ncbi:hypothetical protein T01_16107 [Trichinella spiralis]|uniref:Uncharacterized protein n=1 Tax=Trichinella spiralis TaxID=6334 RepID=A0A0V1BRE5_TRISP|nr:hypothetical protein T01_16107 [Trichinella spiralis]
MANSVEDCYQILVTRWCRNFLTSPCSQMYKRWARLDANVATAEHFDIGRGGSFFTSVQRGNLQQQKQRMTLY